MPRRNALTLILTSIGTALVWLPILAPVFFTMILLAQEQILLFDYLMPAELFPLVMVGGAALVWASARARLHQRLITSAYCTAVGLLVLSTLLSVLGGSTLDRAEPPTWWRGVLLAFILIYSLSVLAMDVGGILVLRDLLRPHRAAA